MFLLTGQPRFCGWWFSSKSGQANRFLGYNTLMNRVLAVFSISDLTTVEIVQGDLTMETVDAVVNAANAHLRHGGGVAGALAGAGGPGIQRESDAWVRLYGPVSHAQPAVTGAGNLPCRYVIHAVGPMWGAGDEDHKLALAIRGSLQQAERLELRSMAFPAISIGIFGFPAGRAAQIYADVLRQEAAGLRCVQLVRIVLWDAATAALFLDAFTVGREQDDHFTA